MHQSNINKSDYYFLDDEYINIIDQLNETVAYSSLVEPIPHTITLWADPGTGIYPLTDERGGTETTTIVVNPETGEMSNVDNIRFTDQDPGTLGLHVEGVDLYYGTFNITDEAFGSNIYNVDGNLLADRVVNLNEFSLTLDSENPSVLSALGDWNLSGVLYTDSEGSKTRTDSIAGKTTSTINVSGSDFNNGIKVYDSGTLPTALDDVFWRSTVNNHLYHNNVDLENLGDVVGPASAIADSIVSFNGTTGKLVKDSGAAISTVGDRNLFINDVAHKPPITSANRCTIFGNQAGKLLTSGNSNDLFGTFAGAIITTSPTNTGIGAYALSSLTTGLGQNVGVGTAALESLGTGAYNIGLGCEAGGNYATTESNNICIGRLVLGTTGESNVIRLGHSSHTSCYITGISGVTPSGTPQYVTIGTGGQLGSIAIPTDHVVGPASAISDSIVTFNGTTGKLIKDSGAAILVPTFSNLFISSSGNTPVITSATNCTTLGTGAGVALTSGSSNTLVGYTAGGSISTSTENTAVGSTALVALTTGGGSNTAVGRSALSGLTTGANNTAVGHLAGLNYTGAETNNILIGKGVFGTVGESSVIRIGNTQTSCYLQGISGTPPGTPQVVTVGTGGRLGSATVSQVLNSASITTVSTTPYTALNTTQMLRVDCSSGAHVVNLPTALTIMKISIVDTGSGSGVNTLTIAANGSDTIYGNASIVNVLPYYSITLQSDGIATWYSV